jgi:chromosome segregation ATPase
MWPKMLLELLPHFARLMPVADKYFNSRSASDKEHQAALAALSQELREGAVKVSEEQASLQRQVQEQSAQIAEIALETTRTRLAVETVEARLAKLEKTMARAVRLLWAVLGLVLIALVVLLVVRRH